MKTTKVSQDALSVLSRVTIEGNLVRLPEQLERTLYVEVNKVLANMGGKWTSGKTKAHVFQEDPTLAIDQVVRLGVITELRKNGFFPTPAEIADQMVTRAMIEEGQHVLEPSCGDGQLVDAILRRHDRHKVRVFGIEKNPELIAKCRAKTYEVCEFDFLQLQTIGLGVDRVVMNPPFELLQDCKHLIHAWRAHLKPGGRLVAIMSPAVQYHTQHLARWTLELIEEFGTIHEIPEGAFKESGTMIRTIMVVMQKPEGRDFLPIPGVFEMPARVD